MPPRYPLVTHLETEVGKVRTNNEDSLAQDPELGLLVLADGMGGYNAGEVASSITTATVLASVRRQLQEPATGAVDRSAPRNDADILHQAVTEAHEAVCARAAADPDCAGMGTTVDAVLIRDGRVTVAHVGDSRVYRYRNGELRQLTTDHSLLEELVARGHYSREEAARYVRKNIVTRALGVEPRLDIDLVTDDVAPGDVYLLCSDGLSDMADDDAIQQIVEIRGTALDLLARALVNTALEAGGRDNISVALARVESGGERPWLHRLRDWF